MLTQPLDLYHRSHLVTIPPGTLLSDALMNSPIIVGEDGTGAVPGLPGTGGDFEFGFDPSTDPELAMVILLFAKKIGLNRPYTLTSSICHLRGKSMMTQSSG